MALINCSECGKEMSSTVKKCPHCGYVNKEIKQEKIDKGTKLIKQYIKVISIIVIIIVIGVVGFIIYNNKVEQDRIQAEIEANRLTDEEKKGASVVKELKNSLKNPESLQVFEIIYGKDSSNIIIDYSGQNGFGGLNRKKIMYSIKADGTISLQGDDSHANDSIKWTANYKIANTFEIATSRTIIDIWGDREKYNYITLDVDKIMRNLDQVD